ncbi:hypothetical protein [Mycobacteroides salmoniphilum]|uniref:hypothetical protein n=1 Tax=Mycobacteroides salmoniphilum TaxID=404941 RepID=UPI0009935261|nr:hypothetical protein [Mycobacteroides salmoniphilum]
MADLSRLSYRPQPEGVVAVAMGGDVRLKKSYVNGVASDEPVLRNSAGVRRIPLAISIDGVGLSGATVETTTPLETVEAGTIFKAEGEIEVSVRADARAGFNGGGPRGVLVVSVFIERLVPVGSAADLLRSSSAPASKRAAGGDS